MRPVQPSVAVAQHHVMLCKMPASGIVNTMIRITGIGDHDRPEWLIRISGMRTLKLFNGYRVQYGKPKVALA
jgi:hypothetical protein